MAKPVLRAFVPCLDIISVPDGTFHLANVLQHVVMKPQILGLPVALELRVYFVWSNLEDEDYQVSISATLPGNDTPMSQEYVLHGHPGGRWDVARDLWLRAPLYGEGDIVFDISLNGSTEAVYKLPVVYRQ